jgi:hypothetical protein
MATTKYIINNLPDQTITGNIRLNGDLKVSDGTYSVSTYKALLTQTATFSGTSISGFGGLGPLIIGETYTIDDYQSGDDFSNISDVVSGIINETGCVFVATGGLPAIWSNGSRLTSSGNLVVSVLSNNLGFDIVWFNYLAPGIYFGFKSNTGPIYNSFPRNYVSIQSTPTTFSSGLPVPLWQYVGVGSLIGDKDEAVYLAMFDFETMSTVPDYLYYTPIEINFKQNLDTTPIVINGSTYSTFPFGNVYIDLYAGENIVETIYANDTSPVNNLSELATLLNSDEVISYLGTFSNVSNNIYLSTTTNIKNQFSSDNTFGFVIFSDGTLPTVTTDLIDSGFPCQADGTVVDEGSSSVYERGFVWSLTQSVPTLADDKVVDSATGSGSFTVNISAPQYPDSYGRAYAINNTGVSYGNVIEFSAPCFAKGTLVTLSDGSTKKIEDITYDDSLLVWNFDESKFDSAKPVWMMKPITISDTFISKFSDGSELITAGKLGIRKTSHRIFNIEKGEFTYLISEQDTPIGTHTFNDKGEIVTLISREKNNVLTQIYNIVTFGHLNMFCSTLLTSVRLNNLYPIKNMKFVKDVREIIPFDKFKGLTKEYYDGFRLGEQPLVEVSENFVETNTTPTLEELIHHMKTYYK